MCHNDTWDSFVLLIMVFGLCCDKPYTLNPFNFLPKLLAIVGKVFGCC